MQVSTKEFRITVNSLRYPMKQDSESFADGFNFAIQSMNEKLTMYEEYKAAHAPELPYAESLTEEKALIVYCTPKLFEFVEKFEDVDDINLIMVGKLWLEVKKFLKEGKFKRV